MGETRPKKIDVRLIAATNVNLPKEVEEGRFRADLFFRLNVVPILIPALRERVDDVEPIARYLLARFSKENGGGVRGFEPEALIKLRQHSWPGNVREMRNVIELAVLLSRGPLVSAANLRLGQEPQAAKEWHQLLDQPLDDATSAFELRYFQRLLQRADGSKTRAAELAGRDRTTIYTYLKKLGIE